MIWTLKHKTEQPEELTTLRLFRRGFNNLISEGFLEEAAEDKSIIYITDPDNHPSQLHVDEVDQDGRTVKLTYIRTSGLAEHCTLNLNELYEFDCFDVRPRYVGFNDVELYLMADSRVQFKRADIKKEH